MCIRHNQRGLSLIELVMFIVIVSVGIVGILSVMNVVTQNSADPMLRKQALAIAESMLEEIQLKDFANPADPDAFTGAATQANRELFDDVSDYHGFSSVGIYPVDGMSAISGLGSYSVAVKVLNDGGLGGIAAVDAKLITVAVTGPAATSITLTGYRTNDLP